MKLKAIVLKNFLQYRYEYITFPDEGIIGIVGLNGKGKSTIFNAIGWVFYGTIKDTVKEDIKNVDAGPREECYVLMIFEHCGETYVIKRHMTKKDECFLKTIDGRPVVQSGRRDLTQYISERFFKMDYTSFCACYYAQQNDFDALSKLTPGKRKEILTRLLRIDQLDKSADKARQIIKSHEEAIEKVQHMTLKEEDFVNQKATAEQIIVSEQNNIQQTEETLKQTNELYKNLLVERAEGDAAFQEYNTLKNEYKQHLHAKRTLEERVIVQDEEELKQLLIAQNRYQEIRQSVDEYNQLVEEREEFNVQKTLFQEKTSLIKQLKDIKNDVEESKAEYKSIQQDTKDEAEYIGKLEQLSTQKASIAEQIEAHEKNVQEYNLDIRTIKDKLNHLKTTKEKFEKLGKDSPCPTCERPLGEHFEDTMSHIKTEQEPLVEEGRKIQRQRDELSKAIVTLREQMQSITTEEHQTSSILIAIDKKKERLSYIEKQVQTMNVKYSELLPRYQELKEVHFDAETYNRLLSAIQETKKLHDEALSIQHSLDKIPSLEERIASSKEEAKELSQTLDSLEARIKALGFDEAAYKKLTSQIEETQNAIHESKESVTKSNYEIKNQQSIIERIGEQLKEIEKVREDIVQRRNEMAFYLKLIEAYKSYKGVIIAKLTPDLSDIMSDYIEQVTDGYYEKIELDKDFNIFIYRLGQKKPLSFYSGGEQKLAALLQLLGVSNLLTSQTGQASFDMVAMDEVLGTFDDNRQASTIEQLRNLKSIFPQVLMVAHQDLVKDMFDYTLVVSTNEKRHSQAKWMREWDDSEIRTLLEPYISA